MKQLLTIFFLAILATGKIDAQAPSLITIKNQQFLLNGQPYYFVGANYWYGSLLPLEKDKSKGIERLRKELDFLKANNVTNLRVLAGAEGKGIINGHIRVGPALQPEDGVFDQHVLQGMDIFLHELSLRKMTAVLYLSNNWNWSGGFPQYLQWNNLYPDSVFLEKIPWTTMGEYNSKFYTCEKCMDGYYNQAKQVINRTNTITGKKYTEDPTIMAWQIANEPRPMHPDARDAYKKFIANAAAYIKKLDPNHLVSTGTEGYQSTQGMPLYQQINDDKNIDYLTIHIWPKNWGWLKINDFAGSMDSVLTKTNRYISEHAEVAKILNKPMVIEEFGMPRDEQSFEMKSPTTYRDAYYRNMLHRWLDNKSTTGSLAGLNFWAYAGMAKTIKGQEWWKEGDPYTGDPTMEEQGLNSIFNADKSTWQLIDSTTKQATKKSIASPIDSKATKETVNLYHNLKKVINKGIMFGHQDDLAYGVNWKYKKGRSDIKDVTGDYPALFGYELGHLEIDSPVNLDSVPFDKMKTYIEWAYKKGSLITLSWHVNNPLTGENAWFPAHGTVASVLPGGSKHALFLSWLDKVAAFAHDLKGPQGEAVPVIFRPFHELNGNWFWWGKKHCSPEQYKELFRLTVAYLRDEKNVHNFLYAFSTDAFSSKEEYLERYPGDEWVDIVGFDFYQREKPKEDYLPKMQFMLTTLEQVAKERNKIPTLTEFGGKLDEANWWTETFLKALGNHKMSYVLGWRNAGLKSTGEMEYYVPYTGHLTEKDFKTFVKEPRILLQKDVKYKMLYK